MRTTPLLIGCLASALGISAVIWFGVGRKKMIHRASYEPHGRVTFTKDVTPIIFLHCTKCHRPGQAAPFSLLTYRDVQKRAQQIAEVTAGRVMPPWLPEAGIGVFADERKLSDDEIAVIQRWVTEGTVEGDPSHLPALPRWTEGWQLGQPDLVITMPEAYTVAAEGKDVYRNFVLPIPVMEPRFVRAVEFRPDNPSVIHHAVMQIDSTPSSRLLDEQDSEPGFTGIMIAGNARPPDGHFLGWTPGKVPFQGRPGMAWRLAKGADLVLQLHFRTSGRPEQVRSSVGLYFTEQAPTQHLYSLVLRNKFIDIAPGEKSYVVRQSYVLPVDVDALTIYPHAHYLAREMKVWAALPNGAEVTLISIKEWDFNWQDEYRYVWPISLPRGATLQMAYTYDNSEGNVRNPNQPPERVVYGRNSTDEMAEVLLQVLPRSIEDRQTLRQDFAHRALLEDITRHEQRLKVNPDDAGEHRYLGLRYEQIGKDVEAIAHFRQALKLDVGSAESHFLLGNALARSGQFNEALGLLREAVRRAPDQPVALNALARVLATHPDLSLRDPDAAIRHAERAAELTQHQDPMILDTLALAYAQAGQINRAEAAAQSAIKLALEADAAELAEQIRQRLESYKAGKQR